MVSVVILAAGHGTRMKSGLPKVFHTLGGKAIVHHVIDAALGLNPSKVITIISPLLKEEAVRGGRSVDCVVQSHPQGTGDAVRKALPLIHDNEDVLILCGDTPLLLPETLHDICKARQRYPQGIIVVGMRVFHGSSYGRMITDDQGRLQRIVEFKDATPEEQAINLCNSGVILARGCDLRLLLAELQPHNAAQEYYLTDIVALGAAHQIPSWVVEIEDIAQLQGINTRGDLALAEYLLQDRWRRYHLSQGVTMIDPHSVYFHHDTIIGQDTTIYPNVTFGPEVVVGKEVIIYPYCYMSKATLKDGVHVGPFAHLRDHVVLEEKAEVGNFVEVKNTHLGQNAKVKHLSYLGDALIHDRANIGAGTITCNYNGFAKSKTEVGVGAFIGSNTSLVAPVKVGDGAIVAAGSVITEDIPENSLGIARQH
ncbi:MAG TPA: bifunctional UDP-N-acetylglucosamine diphosphorylase/glucosamine-1-phosphate N-acetyltransferase GlmU, partial [Candidatus Nitrosotenuis sp.]|nr:bifunctional UDP-N-acetylglucosamine diphosphorylase/glucosamine-1-phosphate N-acetyltransferase GlmU [Candidatus Nitrosotenuis sp.]